jgi:hypothetical protein
MVTTLAKTSLLELARWEPCQLTPATQPSNQCSLMASCRHVKPVGYLMQSSSTYYIYHFDTDAWQVKFDAGASTTGGAASTVVASTWSTGSTVGVSSLTATSGTTTSIVTNQNFVRDLRGYKVHILSGPNAGATLTITGNTTGANSTIYVDAQGSAFSASTTYRLLTPRFYWNWGSGGPVFRVYDYATDSVTTLSLTSGPGASSNDAMMVATPSWKDSGYLSFATGTATSATASTLVNSAKSWTTNQWSNSQVRIVSGTGAGQIRTISSNTATTLTVSANWTTTPDSTSAYSIEGNDDYLYWFGNGTNTLLRYSISGNSWTSLATRAAVTGGGCQGFWPHNVTDAAWTSESSIQNGRYIYSQRGSTNVLDIYDIALNSWTAKTTSSAFVPTSSNYRKFCYPGGDFYYLFDEQSGTSGALRFHIPSWSISGGVQKIPTSTLSGGTYGGQSTFDAVFTDGNTSITYIYYQALSSGQMFRLPIY